MTHELKVLTEYYEALKEGSKTFEVRKDDRNYQVGDTLILIEWLSEKQEYTNRTYFCRVTYTLRDPTYVKEGYVILGIK